MSPRTTVLSALAASLLALLPLQIAAQEPAATGKTELSAEPKEVDFGDAYQGETLLQKVTLKNVGDTDWQVGRIQTSCGCTVAKLFGPDGTELPTRSKTNESIVTLQPGEEVKVDVKFETAGKQGAINQRMQIHNVDPSITPVSVPVTVHVAKALQITPAWVNLGNISKSETVEAEVVIESLEIGDWDIAGFTSQVAGQELPDFLKFEILDEKGPSRRIKLLVEGDRPVAPISPRVRVLIDHERVGHIDFTVTGIVQPNVSFSAGETAFQENISFDQVAPTETVTRTLTIQNKDPSVPYALESVDLLTTQKEFFVTEVRAIEEGVAYEVDITVDGKIGAPFFRGSMVLRAEHPDVPSKTIPFHGWVRK